MTVPAARSASLSAFDLATAQDVFVLRRIGQSAAEALGMDRQDQVRIATALSELGRDRLGCTGLTVSFTLPPGPESVLAVVFEWDGGTETGSWDSGTKPAPDLEPAARLLNRVRHESGGARERIVAEHPLPADWSDTPAARLGVRAALRRHAPMTLADDLRAQTRDLIATLEETRAQREELR
ncbi:hybrid sensor histidine kinase/response regulator, partial [Streptomyces sp. SID2119]|nr:hybrid sensor histidine kinase/response regulator [Streptomyces sp. SID2119]